MLGVTLLGQWCHCIVGEATPYVTPSIRKPRPFSLFLNVPCGA